MDIRAGSYARVSDEGDEQSPERQRDENREAAADHSWVITAEFADQLSASRYARRARPEWPKFVAQVRAGTFDIAILWESSRGARELENWAGFLNAAQRTGTRIYITSRDKIYDLADSEDYRTLATDGVDSVYESEKISKRSRSGVTRAVRRGEPYGRLPYGYRREYQRVPGRPKPVATQLPDPDTAPIVTEIFTRLAAGGSVAALIRDLDRRGVLNPSGRPGWARSTITRMVLDGAVYVGQRRHNGSGLIPGNWPPLVPEDVYQKARAVLSDPRRKAQANGRGGIRPGSVKWLLSYVAACDRCSAPLSVTTRPRAGQTCVCDHCLTEPIPTGKIHMYRCSSSAGGCASAPVSWLDGVVGDAVVRWLAEPGRYEDFTRTDDREALARRDELAAERARLDGFERQAVSGRISADTFARVASGIEARIAELERSAEEASVPPALAGLLAGRNPTAYRRLDVLEHWEAMPLPARRAVVAAVAAPTLAPGAGRGLDPARVALNWRTA